MAAFRACYAEILWHTGLHFYENHNMFTRIQLLCSVIVLCMAGAHVSHAAIVISDIEFGDYDTQDPTIATSLSFKLVGTVEDVVGANGKNALYIGEPGNGSWVLGYHAGTWTSDEAMVLPEAVTVLTEVISDGANGDRAAVGLTGGVQEPPVFEYGQFVSGTFSLTGGSFNPGATDTSNWIVSAGYNTFTFPDPTTATGAAAPEPTSLIVFALGGMIVGMRRRRRVVATTA